MNRVSRLLLGTALLLAVVPVMAADTDKDKEKPDETKPEKIEAPKSERKKGVYQADRAGWLMGMFIGEEKGQQYPIIFQVAPKSEAKDQGIRPGDEIMRFQDEPAAPLKKLFERVNETKPGRLVKLWIRRGSQTLQFEISMPENPGATPEEEAAATKPKKSDDDKSKDDKKKSKKKAPVVIKPIPTDN
jgi:S1-C subfamily serine protease